ncbi:MAG: hypothetical protein K2I10_09350 [Lachnospiraceae bacterium]|nr:hypothetical protein [Lachnospiraceae bacterium]
MSPWICRVEKYMVFAEKTVQEKACCLGRFKFDASLLAASFLTERPEVKMMHGNTAERKELRTNG